MKISYLRTLPNSSLRFEWMHSHFRTRGPRTTYCYMKLLEISFLVTEKETMPGQESIIPTPLLPFVSFLCSGTTATGKIFLVRENDHVFEYPRWASYHQSQWQTKDTKKKEKSRWEEVLPISGQAPRFLSKFLWRISLHQMRKSFNCWLIVMEDCFRSHQWFVTGLLSINLAQSLN